MTGPAKNTPPLRTLAKDCIGERMRALGFDKHRAGTFFREADYGRLGMTYAFSAYGETLKIEVSASIRIDEVEKILFEYRNSIPDKFPPPKTPNEFTVCMNLGNIRGGGWKQWFVSFPDDIEETVDEIIAIVSSVGIPFLDSFGNPRSLMNEMTSAFTKPSVFGSPVFFYERFFILTCVLNRCDLFYQMRPLLEERVRNNIQTPLNRVSRFLDWLGLHFCA